VDGNSGLRQQVLAKGWVEIEVPKGKQGKRFYTNVEPSASMWKKIKAFEWNQWKQRAKAFEWKQRAKPAPKVTARTKPGKTREGLSSSTPSPFRNLKKPQSSKKTSKLAERQNMSPEDKMREEDQLNIGQLEVRNAEMAEKHKKRAAEAKDREDIL
jgi:hypothetical protein